VDITEYEVIRAKKTAEETAGTTETKDEVSA
jgi:hypothetical protein